MTKTRILVIEARFYDHLADMLLEGATRELDAAGVNWDKATVPGVLELPAALSYYLAANAGYDGYVVLGTAILGETDHYHHVCTECMRGCSQLSMTHNLALGNAVLAVHNEEQALRRADPARRNMGGQAARACLRMLALKRELKLA